MESFQFVFLKCGQLESDFLAFIIEQLNYRNRLDSSIFDKPQDYIILLKHDVNLLFTDEDAYELGDRKLCDSKFTCELFLQNYIFHIFTMQTYKDLNFRMYKKMNKF